MNIRILSYPKTKWIHSKLRQTRCTPKGAQIMERKFDSWVIHLDDVPFQAANIIKQEMLSSDGEASVAAGAVEGRITSTPVLLIANSKTLEYFIDKLYNQPYGLPALADGLRGVIQNIQKPKIIKLKDRTLDLSTNKASIMAIINATDDSFYAQSQIDRSKISQHIQDLVNSGADILDIGGQATNPKAKLISDDEELSNLIPILEICKKEFDIPVSIDTFRPKVAEEAVKQKVDIINDVSNLSDIKILDAVKYTDTYYILTHNRGPMDNMDKDKYANYRNTVSEVYDEINASVEKYLNYGASADKLIIDIGLGFAKNIENNVLLLNHIPAFEAMGYPMLVGHSRKRFIGSISGAPQPEDRLAGSLAVMGYAYQKGARLFRVHDVLECRRYLNSLEALRDGELINNADFEEYQN